MTRSLAAVLVAFILPSGALAQIGDNITSFSAQTSIPTTHCTESSNASFSVKTCTNVHGRNMRYYSTLDGSVVFGVAWDSGRTHPNYDHILGENAKAVRDKESQMAVATRGKPQMSVVVGDITVEKGGRPGNVHGRAWDKKLFPQGVTEGDIK